MVSKLPEMAFLKQLEEDLNKNSGDTVEYSNYVLDGYIGIMPY